MTCEHALMGQVLSGALKCYACGAEMVVMPMADKVTAEAALAAARHQLALFGCRDGHDDESCPLCTAEAALAEARALLTARRLTMSGDADRAVFEAWIVAPPYERSIARWPHTMTLAWPSQYHDLAVQLAWEAWQESRAVGNRTKTEAQR